MSAQGRPVSAAWARLRDGMRALVVALVATLAAAQAQAPPSVRVALVIGNAAYAASPLANPVNDARAMGQTLQRLGFDVIELRDGNRAQMVEALGRLHSALKGRQGVGLLYYAGHGVQIETRNYMIPVDARLRTAADLREQAVDVSQAIDALRGAGARLNIIVLDACRNNPFGALGSGRGLAPMDAPSGTFLAYATAPGNVSADAAKGSANGLYTHHLLQEIARPNSRIEDVFKRVRFAVRQASGGQQIPWESTSLEEDFRFHDGRIVAAKTPGPQQIGAQFNEEVALWDKIKNSTRVEDFYDFLQRYPNGPIAEAAHARLNALSQPVITVQGAAADGSAQRYTVGRFREGDVYEQRITASGMAGAAPSTAVVRVRKVGRDRIDAAIENSALSGDAREQPAVFDPAGGMISLGSARFDPPQSLVPGGLLQLGLQWQAAVRTTMPALNMNSLSTLRARIVAREQVTVPAGTFDAFRIETVTTTALPGQPEQTITQRYWVAPDLAVPVRLVYETNVPSVGVVTTVNELVRFSRGR
jgi:uncharacterized caspase-like protein